ncbi:Mechanosensitive ion channel protein [Pleurostoma richardsiae]|uniref:Mechanosensitive ion channel protein n=1 Tax=Pleurostoma richardsiae TaxID=41990 RepID=A0AA38S2H2_9PEZI|nr:Mechanosensitive ion channel protein [Pleurostoma richardsiae]
MSHRSPRSPSKRGFMPLSNDRSDRSDTMVEGDIPLTKIGTSASSTGARKPFQSVSNRSEEQSADQSADEKNGLFHHRSHKSHRGPAGRRKLIKDDLASKGRRGTFGSEEFSLNAMGRLYNKIIGFSVVTRYLIYVVPVAILLAVPLVILPITDHGVNDEHDIFVGGTLTKNGTVVRDANGDPVRGGSLFMLFLWIEISWLSLWAAKLFAQFLPQAFMFFCGIVSSGTRKYARVLKNLDVPVSLFFWALISWLVFKNFFKNTSFEWIYVVTNILGSLFVSSAVFLGEKAIVQLISITYHQRSFANRIHDSKREIFLLGLLYDASRTLFPMYCPEFMEEDYIINDSIEMMLGVKKQNKRGGGATPMRFVGGVARVGDKITSVVGNIASEVTGKQVFNPNSAHSIVIEALEKVRTSEALARRIWMSFAVEGRDSLLFEDIVEVLGPGRREEAEEAFEAIDSDQNGDISLDEMVRKVVAMGKERKAITNSMKDIGQALRVFDQILLFVVALIVIFIFLAFFQSSFITTLTTAGTTLLSLSFIFAVTCQEFLGSCIFLFVKHPYDVGDRVDITGPEKEQLIVEKISLLFTVFTRIDKMQVVQIPNIVLNTLWVENVTRSKAMKEIVDVNISFDTTFEDIELLRSEMEKFVRHPDNSRDFQSDVIVNCDSIGDLDKLNLKIIVKHKSNWHNEAVRAARRSKFMCALALALKKIPVNGPGGGGTPLGDPANPSYSVTVTDDIAAAARAKAEKDKLAARMVPPKTKDTDSAKSSTSTKAEEQAIANLSTRDPVAIAVNEWGYNRDDQTLHSRDASLERQRSNEIETLRSDLNRMSTRGRRKPGEAIPPAMPLGEDDPPNVTVTQYHSAGSNRSFDVESQTGAPPSNFTGMPYVTPVAGPSGSQFSTPAATYAPTGTTNNALNPVPSQGVPLQTSVTTGAASGVSGASGRSGGTSASSSRQPQQPYGGQRPYPGV